MRAPAWPLAPAAIPVEPPPRLSPGPTARRATVPAWSLHASCGEAFICFQRPPLHQGRTLLNVDQRLASSIAASQRNAFVMLAPRDHLMAPLGLRMHGDPLGSIVD